MLIGIHHLGLQVADPAGAPWLDHVQTLPLPESNPNWIGCPNVWIAVQSQAESCLEPSRDAKPEGGGPSPDWTPRPVHQPGLAHICLQSRDIEVGLARGVAAGLQPISGPVDLGTPFRYLYAHTRDGVLLELEGAPFVRGALPEFWVGHVAFVARDIDALTGFYGRVLGLSATPRLRLPPRALHDQVTGLNGVDLSAIWVPGLNVGLEFWHFHHPAWAPVAGDAAAQVGWSHICFESTDFEVDCAHLRASGAQPIGGSLADTLRFASGELALRPDCQYTAFRDPEGSVLTVLAFKDRDNPLSLRQLPYASLLADIAAQVPR